MTPRTNAFRSRTAAGFTLLELMVVVAIIGVLAAIALPSYRIFLCRTRQAEAKVVLQQITRNEEVYYAENDTYVGGAAADTAFLDTLIEGNAVRYSYSIVATASGYTATAAGIDVQTGDLWTIDQTLTLTHQDVAPTCQ